MDREPSGLRDVGDKPLVNLRPVNFRIWIRDNNFDNLLLIFMCVPETPELIGNKVGDSFLAPLLSQYLRPARVVDGLGRGAVDCAEERGYEEIITVVDAALHPRTWRCW